MMHRAYLLLTILICLLGTTACSKPLDVPDYPGIGMQGGLMVNNDVHPAVRYRIRSAGTREDFDKIVAFYQEKLTPMGVFTQEKHDESDVKYTRWLTSNVDASHAGTDGILDGNRPLTYRLKDPKKNGAYVEIIHHAKDPNSVTVVNLWCDQ